MYFFILAIVREVKEAKNSVRLGIFVKVNSLFIGDTLTLRKRSSKPDLYFDH